MVRHPKDMASLLLKSHPVLFEVASEIARAILTVTVLPFIHPESSPASVDRLRTVLWTVNSMVRKGFAVVCHAQWKTWPTPLTHVVCGGRIGQPSGFAAILGPVLAAHSFHGATLWGGAPV